MSTRFHILPLAIAMASAFPLYAQQNTGASTSTVLPEVQVFAEKIDETPYHTVSISDPSRLLSDSAGYSTATGGGVSGLPSMNGFIDDRLKIRVDGMEITSACANHMNAPLSYSHPALIGSIKLYSGVTPVSLGGDSIGGTIEVKSSAPVFARAGEGVHTEGRISSAARSVDNSFSAGIAGTVATENLSITYSGSHARGESYKDGNANKILGSMYESNNDLLTIATKSEGQQTTIRVGGQRIPFQGFPNQYMDMTENRATFANAGYAGDMSWGKLTAAVYWQDTAHTMGFFSAEKTGAMPMNTRGRDIGYALKAERSLKEGATLRIGNEFHRFMLEDWWPAIAGSMMMGPDMYKNINGGQRDRFVAFAEWEGKINQQWSAMAGIRNEIVTTDADNVQPYGSGMMQAADVAAAAAFNGRSRNKRDSNVDLTALTRYEPGKNQSIEFGYARKTRSPNLYERYSWGRGSMAMTMTNWFGDGNGYVGDIDLKPEVAHTLSLSSNWHDEEKKAWDLTASPYYSYVNNYIDADVIGTFNPYSITSASGALLRFANHDARLYGLNLSWKLPVVRHPNWGDLQIRGNASMNRGERTDGQDLYRIMPLNGLIAVDQTIGAWLNTLEARLVARKSRLDNQRLEPATSGFTIVNIRTSFQLNHKANITAGISNLFNKSYADPMGGVYLSGLKSAGAGSLAALPGYGRSVELGLSIGF
jgi:iron complex outermembrane receptor protein